MRTPPPSARDTGKHATRTRAGSGPSPSCAHAHKGRRGSGRGSGTAEVGWGRDGHSALPMGGPAASPARGRGFGEADAEAHAGRERPPGDQQKRGWTPGPTRPCPARPWPCPLRGRHVAEGAASAPVGLAPGPAGPLFAPDLGESSLSLVTVSPRFPHPHSAGDSVTLLAGAAWGSGDLGHTSPQGWLHLTAGGLVLGTGHCPVLWGQSPPPTHKGGLIEDPQGKLCPLTSLHAAPRLSAHGACPRAPVGRLQDLWAPGRPTSSGKKGEGCGSRATVWLLASCNCEVRSSPNSGQRGPWPGLTVCPPLPPPHTPTWFLGEFPGPRLRKSLPGRGRGGAGARVYEKTG